MSPDNPTAKKPAKKPTEEQLQWSSTIAAALFRFVKEYDLDAMSYDNHGVPEKDCDKLQFS